MKGFDRDWLNQYEQRRRAAQANAGGEGLCPAQSERAQGVPLVGASPREAKGGNGATQRFLVSYRIYSVRPLDWDNYRIKDVQDLLCLTGLLPDDNWQVLQGSVVSEKAHSKEEEKTEITLTQL